LDACAFVDHTHENVRAIARSTESLMKLVMAEPRTRCWGITLPLILSPIACSDTASQKGDEETAALARKGDEFLLAALGVHCFSHCEIAKLGKASIQTQR
jgi:hypothetical protein